MKKFLVTYNNGTNITVESEDQCTAWEVGMDRTEGIVDLAITEIKEVDNSPLSSIISDQISGHEDDISTSPYILKPISELNDGIEGPQFYTYGNNDINNFKMNDDVNINDIDLSMLPDSVQEAIESADLTADEIENIKLVFFSGGSGVDPMEYIQETSDQQCNMALAQLIRCEMIEKINKQLNNPSLGDNPSEEEVIRWYDMELNKVCVDLTTALPHRQSMIMRIQSDIKKEGPKL